MEPWSNKDIPDLALLITQILLLSETLFGQWPDQLLCAVPYRDFVLTTSSLLAIYTL